MIFVDRCNTWPICKVQATETARHDRSAGPARDVSQRWHHLGEEFLGDVLCIELLANGVMIYGIVE